MSRDDELSIGQIFNIIEGKIYKNILSPLLSLPTTTLNQFQLMSNFTISEWINLILFCIGVYILFGGFFLINKHIQFKKIKYE